MGRVLVGFTHLVYVPLLCGSCQTLPCPLTLALISARTSSQLAAATVLILMPHATPKETGVEGQTPSKEELDPFKALAKPWKVVTPATPRVSMPLRVLPGLCGGRGETQLLRHFVFIGDQHSGIVRLFEVV